MRREAEGAGVEFEVLQAARVERRKEATTRRRKAGFTPFSFVTRLALFILIYVIACPSVSARHIAHSYWSYRNPPDEEEHLRHDLARQDDAGADVEQPGRRAHRLHARCVPG